jgi:transposase InsO family protein
MKCLKNTVFRSPAAGDEAGYDQAGMRSTRGLLMRLQYTSSEFRGILKAFNAIQSMSRKGDCWDNAVAESFFATIKGELIDRQQWISKVHARVAIVEWIECFYNNQRRHSSIGGICPVEYESLTGAMQAA